MWRKEIRFDFETDQVPDLNDDLPMMVSKRWECKMIVTFSIHNGFSEDMRLVRLYKGEGWDYLEAIKEAFQNFLNRKMHQMVFSDNNGRFMPHKSCPLPLDGLPMMLEIKHLTQGFQDLIKEVFEGNQHDTQFLIKLLN